jgi:hypothetical protein
MNEAAARWLRHCDHCPGAVIFTDGRSFSGLEIFFRAVTQNGAGGRKEGYMSFSYAYCPGTSRPYFIAGSRSAVNS